MNKHRFVWHDLNTKDIEGSKKFYGEIFNWKFDESKTGPYSHIQVGDQLIGGMRQMGPEPGPTNWLGYMVVDDVAAAVGTISYEVVTAIRRRVPRVYRRGGRVVATRTLSGGYVRV